MKKILAFIGSPNQNGRTAAFVKEVVKGAENTGAFIKTYYMNNMDIKYCQGCKHCRIEGQGCILKDDMQEVYREFLEADAIIIGSPIYALQVTAQTKILIDRLCALLGSNMEPSWDSKKVVMVYSQGVADPKAFEGYFKINEVVVKKFGLELIDTIVYAGYEEDRKSELLLRAFRAGEVLTK